VWPRSGSVRSGWRPTELESRKRSLRTSKAVRTGRLGMRAPPAVVSKAVLHEKREKIPRWTRSPVDAMRKGPDGTNVREVSFASDAIVSGRQWY